MYILCKSKREEEKSYIHSEEMKLKRDENIEKQILENADFGLGSYYIDYLKKLFKKKIMKIKRLKQNYYLADGEGNIIVTDLTEKQREYAQDYINKLR